MNNAPIVFTITSEEIKAEWDKVRGPSVPPETLDEIAREWKTGEESLKMIVKNPNSWESTKEYIFARALSSLESDEAAIFNFGRRLATRLSTIPIIDFSLVEKFIQKSSDKKTDSERIIINGALQNINAPIEFIVRNYKIASPGRTCNLIGINPNTPLYILKEYEKYNRVDKRLIYLNPSFPVEDCLDWLIEQTTEAFPQEDISVLEIKADLALTNYGMLQENYADLPLSWKLETLKALSGIQR